MTTLTITRLARILDQQGRRQDWLAERTGYTRAYINRLARGHVPMTTQAAERLAQVLQIPSDYLVPATDGRSEEVA